MEIKTELIDELLKDYRKPEDIIGENGLWKRFVKAVMERALNAELTHHLGYEKHDPVGNNSGNSRNGASSKTVKGDFGELEIEVPRDRVSTFEPQILPKHQTRFTGFDDKIVSLYARGMTTREIEGHLKEIYGGSQRRADLPSDRGGQRRGADVAEPGAGAHLRDRVPGCAVRENAARRARGKPGRAQRGAGAVDQRQ